ncbi:MAG: hypothetical protein WC655_22415 [Candidatus Hydrogenedentales bacterium]|jgi:hypothetical protein
MDHITTPARNSNADTLSDFGPPRAETPERPSGIATYVGDAAQQAATSVTQSAVDAASFVGRKAEDAATFVGQKTEEAGAAVGGSLRSLGNTVRERGPESGMAGDATTAVADSLESSGRYLQEEGLKEMAEDVTKLIRRNPIQSLVIGVAAGYLVGRAMSPRS